MTDVKALADGLVALIPSEVKALILASDEFGGRTAGSLAKAAGLKSGAYAVQFLRDAGFHERALSDGLSQYLWRLNALGQQVRAELARRQKEAPDAQ